MNKLPLLLLPLSLAALAETPPVRVPEPVFFENRETAQMPSETPLSPEPAAPRSDGLVPQNSLEAQINGVLVRRDWSMLPPLLARYRNLPAHDQTLYDYALGALRRSQLRHKEAVALYRGIAARHPDLAYPRFDLGVMLFEDRQYRAAQAELQRALPDLSLEMQNIAARYLSAIGQSEGWQPEVSLQYETTNNVNNAADARFIEIDGRRWQKTADSLPQRAHGLRYGLAVSREKNLGSHHYVYAKLGADGVSYWDNHDFDEQSLNIAAGYKNHSVRHSLGLVPFFEQNWLGGSRYNRACGIQADFSRRLGTKWRVMFNAGYIRKRYQEPHTAERYNGKMPTAGATLMYAAPNGWLFYGGADWSHDLTRETEQASVRKGIRIGAAKTFSDGLGIRANLRHTRRSFDEAGSLVYLFERKDREFQANVSLWHNKISWKGFTPHLNFRYLNIDSNMPAFYSRQNRQFFISVEKQF